MYMQLGDDTFSAPISFNYCTDSMWFQHELEEFIDKRSGRIYGPPSNKKLLYFVDNLNLPCVEEYGTQVGGSVCVGVWVYILIASVSGWEW